MFTSNDHNQEKFQCPNQNQMMIIENKNQRWKSHQIELAPNCPRCASSNTKFCYYNNYSLSQPRYFCKSCRRYWTKGGSLRNVPIGGGCRKNRQGKSIRVLSTTNRSSPRMTSNCHHRGGGGGGSCLHESLSIKGDDDDSIRNLGNAVKSSSSSISTSSTTIDLALVYAKYLNNDQQSDCNSRVSFIPTHPELPKDHHQFNSLFEFTDTWNHHPNNIQITISEEQFMFPSSTSNYVVGDMTTNNLSPKTQLSEIKQVFLGQEVPLPPPSDEDVNIVLQDNLWLNSHNNQHILGTSNFSALQLTSSTQLQSLDPTIVDDDHHHQSTLLLHLDPLDTNWSSFDLLQSYETFPTQ